MYIEMLCSGFNSGSCAYLNNSISLQCVYLVSLYAYHYGKMWSWKQLYYWDLTKFWGLFQVFICLSVCLRMFFIGM